MVTELPGYQHLELIGEGGLGRVYRATRTSTGGPVAIKELRDVASASPAWHRARRELEAMLRLKGHAGVTSVEEILDGPDGPCIVMEFLAGGSLMDRLAHGPLSLPEIVLVGREVAEALAAAHDAGVVHRDVKPHNLLISSFGHVKVCDFGISALARDAGGRTQTNALTLAYASPEELDGSLTVGPPADAYSLSATLQHLYTGHKPSFQERMSGGGTLQQMAGSPDPTERSVMIALAVAQSHDPSVRPTMHQMVAIFDRAANDLGDRRLMRLPELGSANADGRTIQRPVLTPIQTVPRPLPAPQPAIPPPPQQLHMQQDVADTVARPGPVLLPDTAVPRRRDRGTVIAIVGAVAGLIAVAVLAATLLLGGGDDKSSATDTEHVPTTEVERTTTTVTIPDSTLPSTLPSFTPVDVTAALTVPVVVETASPTIATEPPTIPTEPSTLPPVPDTEAPFDPTAEAQAQLDALVEEDRAYVNGSMVSAKVAQVSAKYLNQVDLLDGLMYDAPTLLAHYNELNERFGGVVIIRQDEYNHTKSRPNLYQILVKQPFATKDDGTAWCHANGLEVPDQCYARDLELA
jgi:serine/threonine protein kinase